MSITYHPGYLKQRMQGLKYRLGGVTEDLDAPGLCKEWFDDPDRFVLYIGDPPEPDHVLVHLDKSKWYGPGNVKWGSRALVRALRVDNPRLAEYYASRPLPAPLRVRPKPLAHEGKTLREWSRESGVSVYMIQQAMMRHPGAPMVKVIDAAHRDKATPRGKRGPIAKLYEGKTIREWSQATGVPQYYIRKHLSRRPMAEIVALARRNYTEGQRTKGTETGVG